MGLSALDDAPMPRAAKIVADPIARAEPDAGARHVVVPQPEPRCVDRAGARRERTRASRRDAVGGVAARRPRVRVQVGPPCFIDPEGERLRG